MWYKFWITREEREFLDKQKAKKRQEKMREKALDLIEYGLLHSKDANLWSDFGAKQGPEYEAVKKLIDTMNFAAIDWYIRERGRF